LDRIVLYRFGRLYITVMRTRSFPPGQPSGWRRFTGVKHQQTRSGIGDGIPFRRGQPLRQESFVGVGEFNGCRMFQRRTGVLFIENDNGRYGST